MAVIDHMKLLISLAQIDGKVAEREESYIRNIGQANGLSEHDMASLFKKQHPVIVPSNLSDDQKFNCIFTLVQLMKIDERLYKEEMLFCSTIASSLGYEKDVMFDLLMHIKTTGMADDEVSALKELTLKYLK